MEYRKTLKEYLDEEWTIGRKVSEIMSEKGKAFSIQAVASRLNINRETFRQMLTVKKRGIYDFELKQIAEILDVPTERITKEDVKRKREQLDFILRETTNSEEESVSIAQELFNLAVGVTERCISLIDLGRAHYKNQRYDETHKLWLEAHKLAVEIQGKYDDPYLLEHVLRLLELSCSVRNDYSNMSSHLSQYVPIAEATPQLAAYNRYFLAKVSEKLGNFTEAKNYYYEYYSIASKHETLSGGSKLNVANFEYRMKNYAEANKLYSEAETDLNKADDEYGQVVVLKEYAKCLIKQGEKQLVKKKIQQALLKIENSLDGKVKKLESNFHLLLARVENDPQHAIELLSSQNTDIRVKRITSKYLLQYYLEVGDVESIIKYLKLSNELNNIYYDVLDEEDL